MFKLTIYIKRPTKLNAYNNVVLHTFAMQLLPLHVKHCLADVGIHVSVMCKCGKHQPQGEI